MSTIPDLIDDIRDALLHKQHATTNCAPTQTQREAATRQAGMTIKVISNVYMCFNGGPPSDGAGQALLDGQIIAIVQKCSHSRIVDLSELRRELETVIAETAKLDTRRQIAPKQAMDTAAASRKRLEALSLFTDTAPLAQVTVPVIANGRSAKPLERIGDFFTDR